MQSGVNKVELEGNMTRDPELRSTGGGQSVTNISVAVNDFFKDKKSKEVKETVEFIDVTVWGKDADKLCRDCKKGQRVKVLGRLHVESWDDKDSGKKRYKTVVVASSCEAI